MNYTGKWNAANIISLYRILAIPVLVLLIFLNEEKIYSWMLLVSFVSDIADGIIARTFKLQTEFGARLDSFADMGTHFCIIPALIVFKMDFLSTYYPAIAFVLGLYLIEVLLALLMFGKISSFHTILSKVSAYVQGSFIVFLFLTGFVNWLFYLAIGIAIAGYLEEIILIFVLKENKSNVKGLWFVLKSK